MTDINTIHIGNCLDVLRGWPDGFVQTVVTSPPYWGLRDYGVNGQLGLEPTPEEYIENMVAIFREVRRVLRDDGTAWVNMGDSYTNSPSTPKRNPLLTRKRKGITNHPQGVKCRRPPIGLKPKDLVGMPWRLAFALQADGWWLRSDIIWAKPNPMPESVTDRPTKAHEYIFLLSKSSKYYYDADAIREGDQIYHRKAGGYKSHSTQMVNGYEPFKGKGGFADSDITTIGRNKLSVWSLATQPFAKAHFATFPPKLIEPCILAGTSEKGCCSECGAPWERVTESTQYNPDLVVAGARNVDESRGDKTRKLSSSEYNEQVKRKTTGWRPTCDCGGDVTPCIVLDPFMGAGTTAVVARSLNRRWIGIELNEDYVNMANTRIKNTDRPLF